MKLSGDHLEPYKAGVVPDHWAYGRIREITGKMVAISGLCTNNRKVELILPRTRSLSKYEIAEICATDCNAEPGKTFNDLLCIGFFEVETGGQIVVGESVAIANEPIGRVAGFSDLHYPNHLNIVINSETWFTGIVRKPPMKSWENGASVFNIDFDIADSVSICLGSRSTIPVCAP